MPTELWRVHGREDLHPFVDSDRLQGYLPMLDSSPAVRPTTASSEGDRLLAFFGTSNWGANPNLERVRREFWERWEVD